MPSDQQALVSLNQQSNPGIWVTSLPTPILILGETEVLKSMALRGEEVAVTGSVPHSLTWVDNLFLEVC